ncbi:hypothetical protein Acr_23g0018100 [Actinidia rufa]|uniref:UDP-Glycosyltransferase superfamily protein n=1 Tax=Actinidia rufa TaxID=165716 RepID=A0A7J0GRI5_9ERIC|nr:hypothetical protein Acr_23g0018100 [Actinidia rufa]
MFYGKGLKTLSRCLEGMSLVSKAQYLLRAKVESRTIDALRKISLIPIYSIGPAIPYFNLENNDNDIDCLQWLNSQPKSSVLYISHGSFLSVSKAQMDEIIVGVKNSGVRILWVARGEASWITDLCGGDQILNSKTLVEDWKIGWKVRCEMGDEEHLVTKEEIAGIVQRFMDLESKERKEERKRAKELRETCLRATSKGGSAETDIDAFIQDISQSATPEQTLSHCLQHISLQVQVQVQSCY